MLISKYKIVIGALLIMLCHMSHSQELSKLECEEIYKLAIIEASNTDFSIASKGVSRKEVELHNYRGVIRARIASQALSLDFKIPEHAKNTYSMNCQKSVLKVKLPR